MTQKRILVVDEDLGLRSMLRRGLTLSGYAVELAANGQEALSIASQQAPDLVLLDIMMPGLNGLEVCRLLRQLHPDLPIILLTAKDKIPDRVEGLDAGADDYLVKPFALEELLARIRAQLRRGKRPEEQILRCGDLTIDLATREVRRGRRQIALTAREFDLLAFLARHPRQVFSRDAIFERVWGEDFLGDSNLIDVHIMRLRDKLEAGGERRLIHTIRGAGYALREG